jgi:hypothetical protein
MERLRLRNRKIETEEWKDWETEEWKGGDMEIRRWMDGKCSEGEMKSWGVGEMEVLEDG